MAYENWWVGLAFGYAPDDPAPVYTDVTAFVETISSPIDIVAGDTAETTGDGGSVVLQLDNSDQRFTPGNVNSPYSPNVKSAVRIWIRETAGTLTFDHFQGFVEWPEIQAWTESTPAAPRSQTITMTAVDRLGRLRNSRRFISTLAAHIRGVGISRGLVGFWPLHESGPPVDSVPSGKLLFPVLTQYAFGVINPTDPATPSITFATADPPPGDDVQFVEFAAARDLTTIVGEVLRTSSYALVGDADWFSLGPTDTITLIAWVRMDRVITNSHENQNIISVLTRTFAPTFTATIYLTPAGDVIGYAEAAGGPAVWNTASLTSITRPGERWVPVGLQVNAAAGTAELWIGQQVDTAAVTFTSGGTSIAEFVEVGGQFDGAVAYAQVYVGPAGSYTHDDFLEQHEVGLYGLDQQTTGERIRSILGYAGVPAGELGLIDDGVSVMQPARLAGQSPTDAVADAVTTEQGALDVTGAGLVAFADRRRRYNI